jgi:hypothetical protein
MEGETGSSEQHRLSHCFNNGGMVQGLFFGIEPPCIGSISRTEDVHGLSKTIRVHNSQNARSILAEVGLVVLFNALYILR